MTGEDVRLGIEDLQRRYARQIDDGDLDAWPDFFTDDARYLIISKDSYRDGQEVGFYSCDGKGMLRDRVVCLRTTAVYEPQKYRHILGPAHVVERANGTVTAETSFLVVRTTQDGDMTIFASGQYRDQVVFENGAAKFKDKLVLTDSSRIDTQITMPI